MLVLVTGASGFIGRRLVRRLRSDGRAVRALVLPGEDIAGVGELADCEIARGDVSDRGAMRAAVAGCDRVYHLAAVVGDWGDEARFERVNVDGTRYLLEAATAAGCERFLMVSSIVVYGSRMRTAVCDEDSPREHGVGPYSRTKRASEEVALDYHGFGRVPVTIVRPGNVYGAGSDVWVDSLLGVIRAGQALLIDGGAGDAVLAHVDNVVDVIARAADCAGAAGRIYNANDGSGVTWRAYLNDLAALIDAPAPTRSVPVPLAWTLALGFENTWRALRRTGRPLLTREAVTLLASREPVPVERARRELGYHPIVSYADAMAEIAAYVEGAPR